MKKNQPVPRPLFHLAFPVREIEATVRFYRDRLGLAVDLIEKERCIINFFGHQAVAHLSEKEASQAVSLYPRHFGVIFDGEKEFEAWIQKVEQAGIEYVQKPFTRFPGTPRAHRSFFIKDPSNNLLEFKWYRDPALLFRAKPGVPQAPLHNE